MASKTESYIPRKCSATQKVITAKDHASVQLNIGHVDENGLFTGDYTTFAFSGFIRNMGNADQALNILAAEAGLIKDLSTFAAADKFKPVVKGNKKH